MKNQHKKWLQFLAQTHNPNKKRKSFLHTLMQLHTLVFVRIKELGQMSSAMTAYFI